MTPQVVAHRGASHDRAEHTLGAYTAALDAGADGLECDVRLTADGHLVCVHDRNLRRTARHRGIVSTMELAELNELDFASWKHPWGDLDDEAPELDEEHGRVLTLRKLFEVAADYERPVSLAVETKHPTRYGGLVEKRVAELLTDFGWERPGSPVRVMSFSYTALQRMERLAGVELVMLFDHPPLWPMLRRAIGRDWFVGPGVEDLMEHPRLGASIVRSGHRMYVWTVNTRAELEVCRNLGVEAVISDRPAYIVELLGR
ncbi:glycerophosphodiester phosphodiesterase [Nocardioides pantholopis]|uniref:glycerophosphodiester phosphodiesterase n=1 Tax=Nocardioides pantholopis TaxID=2483798 RepID=UPI000F097BA5|nr:glycerophosphodiester phosphodiesterase family protein [Nocardioides pantholopis]